MEKIKEAIEILKVSKKELKNKDTLRIITQAEELLYIATSPKEKPVVDDKQYRMLLKDRKVQSALGILGLSEYQRKCFLILISSRSLLTAREISAYNDVPHTRVYDVMETLKKYGIETRGGRPGSRPRVYGVSANIMNKLDNLENELISTYNNEIKTGVEQLKKFITIE